ncbi:MAG: helix-turn-helix domain-containing protein [Acutalibacteraceae bacterium]
MSNCAFHEQRVRGTVDFPIEFHHVDRSHPRYQMPFHWHIDYELLRVLSGELVLSLNTNTIKLCAGDVILIQDGVVHGGTPFDCVYECIDFDLNSFPLSGTVCKKELDDLQNHRVTLCKTFPAESEEVTVSNRLFQTLESPQKGYEFTALGLIFELIGLILRNHRYSDADESKSRNSKRVRQLKNALRLIREKYNTLLTLEDLSAAAGMSPKYFCRFFVEMTGRTPIDYLNYYRVECACEQLLYSDESVTEIALSCGFNDLSYFVKTFKKYKGITPGKFRSRRETAYKPNET